MHTLLAEDAWAKAFVDAIKRECASAKEKAKTLKHRAILTDSEKFACAVAAGVTWSIQIVDDKLFRFQPVLDKRVSVVITCDGQIGVISE